MFLIKEIAPSLSTFNVAVQDAGKSNISVIFGYPMAQLFFLLYSNESQVISDSLLHLLYIRRRTSMNAEIAYTAALG